MSADDERLRSPGAVTRICYAQPSASSAPSVLQLGAQDLLRHVAHLLRRAKQHLLQRLRRYLPEHGLQGLAKVPQEGAPGARHRGVHAALQRARAVVEEAGLRGVEEERRVEEDPRLPIGLLAVLPLEVVHHAALELHPHGLRGVGDVLDDAPVDEDLQHVAGQPVAAIAEACLVLLRRHHHRVGRGLGPLCSVRPRAQHKQVTDEVPELLRVGRVAAHEASQGRRLGAVREHGAGSRKSHGLELRPAVLSAQGLQLGQGLARVARLRDVHPRHRGQILAQFEHVPRHLGLDLVQQRCAGVAVVEANEFTMQVLLARKHHRELVCGVVPPRPRGRERVLDEVLSLPHIEAAQRLARSPVVKLHSQFDLAAGGLALQEGRLHGAGARLLLRSHLPECAPQLSQLQEEDLLVDGPSEAALHVLTLIA
mmetsp:Transcript_48256/g.124528  ORF Transcript_48256/g.124528 Transcript_48256/m.124528 type:complete len:425 (-) Transcript_48256:1191-2465(-)